MFKSTHYKLSFLILSFIYVSCEKNDLPITSVDNSNTNFEYNIITNSLSLNPIYLACFEGVGTFYDTTDKTGNCSEEYPADGLYAAMNAAQYDNSNVCGSYIEVFHRNTTKSVIVKVLDRCPECPKGNIDLSRTAFFNLSIPSQGIIDIAWRFLPDPNNITISTRVKEGSSRYWFAMQILNHKYMISKLEVKNAKGDYEVMPRQLYNYFIDNDGVFNGQLPEGPYDIRITDINGNVINTKIPLKIGVLHNTNAQFPIVN